MDYVVGDGKQWIAGDRTWEDVSRGHCLKNTETLCRPGHIGGCKCPCPQCRAAKERERLEIASPPKKPYSPPVLRHLGSVGQISMGSPPDHHHKRHG